MGDLSLSYGSTLFMCVLYITLGCISMMCNTMNLSVYFSNRALLKKYFYFMMLDFGEFVNGVSYILVGTGRLGGLLGGYIDENMTVHDCYFHRYWPHSLILGTELPAYCIVLLSIERITAVMKPVIYNRIFTGRSKFALVAIVPLAGLTSLIVAGISASGEERDRLIHNQMCPIISSTSIWYSTYHFTAIVLFYCVSFCSLAFIKWKTRSYATQRSKDSRIGLMLTITGTSIVLIGSSSYVMLLTRWNLATFDNVIVSLTYAMPGFLSVSNTIINMIFRKELRHQLLYLIGLRDKHVSQLVVTTVSNTAQRKPTVPYRTTRV